MRNVVVGAALAVAVAAGLSCKGSSNSTGPSSGASCGSLPNATTILISNNAVCPTSLTVPRGTRVTFINNDSRVHEMTSDPHPEHTDCIELNQVGNLQVGQQRDSGNLNTARVCRFHDHLNDGNNALKGAITIQ